MYEWNGLVIGLYKWSVTQLDGISNGISIITWGANRTDNIGLANKSTVEQSTGNGTIINKNNPTDYSAGWETGIIYMSNKLNNNILSYTKFIFIHIYKVILDTTNKPYKLQMWEALIEDENKSFTYINQLKNNIGAVHLFGSGAEYKTNATSQLYIPKASDNAIYFIETNYDDTRGIDVPYPSRWVKNKLAYPRLPGIPPS